jgi:hypothetical protein
VKMTTTEIVNLISKEPTKPAGQTYYTAHPESVLLPRFGQGYLNSATECCGIVELSGVEDCDPRGLIAKVAEDGISFEINTSKRVQGRYGWIYQGIQTFSRDTLLQKMRPFILFSTGKAARGRRLAKLITSGQCGDVWESKPRFNPTGHPKLRMWVWEPDVDGLYAWYTALMKKPPKGLHVRRPGTYEYDHGDW